jgi:hypothetical protein
LGSHWTTNYSYSRKETINPFKKINSPRHKEILNSRLRDKKCPTKISTLSEPGAVYSQKVAGKWPADKSINLLFIDGLHEYLESSPLIIPAEDIKEYRIEGWLKDGKMIPHHKHQPSFDRGAKVDFDVWSLKIETGGTLIMHDLNSDFPGVLKV